MERARGDHALRSAVVASCLTFCLLGSRKLPENTAAVCENTMLIVRGDGSLPLPLCLGWLVGIRLSPVPAVFFRSELRQVDGCEGLYPLLDPHPAHLTSCCFRLILYPVILKTTDGPTTLRGAGPSLPQRIAGFSSKSDVVAPPLPTCKSPSMCRKKHGDCCDLFSVCFSVKSFAVIAGSSAVLLSAGLQWGPALHAVM